MPWHSWRISSLSPGTSSSAFRSRTNLVSVMSNVFYTANTNSTEILGTIPQRYKNGHLAVSQKGWLIETQLSRKPYCCGGVYGSKLFELSDIILNRTQSIHEQF